MCCCKPLSFFFIIYHITIDNTVDMVYLIRKGLKHPFMVWLCLFKLLRDIQQEKSGSKGVAVPLVWVTE